MNKTLRLAILAALDVAAVLLSQESPALDATAATDSDALTTIVVTAEKREESLKDVPMSVTALGGVSLDKLQDRDFSDYAALVPGLSLATSQPGFTRLTLRGQNAGGVGSTVAVYLDESPFGSSSALLNGSILSGDFDTWDLQRIEVLRGPQGTLYGANSEGGLLKFVTTAPVLGSFSGAVEATGESVDHGGTGWDTRAVVNLPVGDKVAWRISGFEQNVPGYINDPSRGKSDLNAGHKEGGRVSMLAAPTSDLTIRLTATSQQSDYDGTPAIDVDPVTLKPLHGDLTQERFVSEPSNFKYVNYNAHRQLECRTIQHPIDHQLRHPEFGYVQRRFEPASGARAHRPRPARFGDWAESRRLPRRCCEYEEVHAGNPPVLADFGPVGMAGRRLLHPRARRPHRTPERYRCYQRRRDRRPPIAGDPDHRIHLQGVGRFRQLNLSLQLAIRHPGRRPLFEQ